MSITHFTDEQRDALQEVLNIAMGQAGNSLARILDTFISLSVPRIRLVNVDEVTTAVIDMVGIRTEVTAVRQAFFDDLRGEAIVIYGQRGCKDLADLMGYPAKMDPATETELVLDVTNVLVGAILNGITETLGTEISYSAPSMIAESTPVEKIMDPNQLSWSHALLLEVNYSIEKRDFKSHLLLLMTEDAIDSLRIAVSHFMEAI